MYVYTATLNTDANWRLALAVQFKNWIKPLQLWPSALPKGAQGGDQEWGALCSGKTGRLGLQIVRYFQEKILWVQFLHLPASRKALKSYIVTSDPMTSSNLHETSNNLLQNVCLTASFPHHQNHIYTDLPPYLLEQFLRTIWNSASWAIVLILPQIKFNSQLSCCAFFFLVNSV